MTTESALIEALRGIAASDSARGLLDDAAVIAFSGEQLVLTLDTMVEGVHYLPDDPPETVGWKLVAVNASDLSAKGADPVGCLYSHALGEDGWDHAFLAGLAQACERFRLPLLGGDTVRMPRGSSRSFSLTALGRTGTGRPVPSRAGARPGDRVWIGGTIGDSGMGLALLRGRIAPPDATAWLVERYRRPNPETRLGPALAPLVSAMMDVSDGLLIDGARLAHASATAMRIEVESVPLSAAVRAAAGDSLETRMAAMTAGDDYVLLFTAPPQHDGAIHEAATALDCEVATIGEIIPGEGLALRHGGEAVPLPARLGYQH